MRTLVSRLLWTSSTRFKGDPKGVRAAILEATPTELRDIQAWLKERMNADWLKSQQAPQ